MPGFDGTGPLGQGPMTGGGRRYCIIPILRRFYPFYGSGCFASTFRRRKLYPFLGFGRKRGRRFGGTRWVW